MKRKFGRQLLLESLQARQLFAVDMVVNEDFSDGNAADFTAVSSNARFAGIVDSHSSHGKVFQIDYTRDESSALLSENFQSRYVDVSFDTRFLDAIPASQVSDGWLGIKLSRLLVGDTDHASASMQNELHVYGKGHDGRHRDEAEFQTFIDPANSVNNIDMPGRLQDWITVRYVAQLNTPGKHDGTWTVFINGQKVVDQRDLQWTTSPTEMFSTFWVGGNISLHGQDPAVPIRRQIDNVKVSIVNPTPEIPATTPDNVRVETVGEESVLMVTGTSGNDTLKMLVQNGQANVNFNSQTLSLSGIDRVEVSLGDGNDVAAIQTDAELVIHGNGGNDRMTLSGSGKMFVYGDSGDDALSATGTQAILDGCGGNDWLYAYGGRKLVIGGSGLDQLISMSGTGTHVLISDNVMADAELIDAVFQSLDELAPLADGINDLLVVQADGNIDRIYDMGRTSSYTFGEEGDRVFRRRR